MQEASKSELLPKESLFRAYGGWIWVIGVPRGPARLRERIDRDEGGA